MSKTVFLIFLAVLFATDMGVMIAIFRQSKTDDESKKGKRR